MELDRGHIFCPECKVCRSRPYLGDFQKILEHDDVGISIYRYKVPERDVYERRKGEPREIFILQTAKNVVQLNLDIFAEEFAKCKSYCPRCKEMMRRAEALFKDVPSVHKLGVTGLCGHVNKGDFFYCPPCKDIVDKFLKCTTGEPETDPECAQLQTYLNRSTIPAKLPLFEDAVKSAVALQIKETAEAKRRQEQDKENRDVNINSKGTKTRTSVDKTSSKSKTTNGRETAGSSKSKLEKRGQRSKSATENKSKAQSAKAMKRDSQNDKGTQTRKTSDDRKHDKSMNIMRMLIAQQLKEKLEIERNKRDLVKQREGIEKQAAQAEKKIKEAEKKAKAAEEARRLRFEALLEGQAMHAVASVERVPSVIDECSNASEGVHSVIRGEKIYRTIADLQCARETPVVELKEMEPQTSIVPPPPPSSPTENNMFQALSFVSQHGVLRYSLSNRMYIERGWTLLPKEMIVRKMTLYQMRPARPEFDWFALNRYNSRMAYGSGEALAQFDGDGSARVFYRSGEVALNYYAAEEAHAGQRLVVYSTGERERTVLAMFDYSGNGIVFDQTGNIRLKYNQTEGVVLDPRLGPKTHWKWHSLNDSPALRSVMIDNQLNFKDPHILALGKHEVDSKTSRSTATPDVSDTYMKTIELENTFKAKRTQLRRKFKPYQIKMKALKINDYFSLRILEQSAVYLLYSDGKTRIKFSVGMILDPTTIVDQDIVELGDVANSLDILPARSTSAEELQKIVRRTRTKERLRMARMRRLNPPDPWEGVDHIKCRSVSPPPQTPSIPCRRFSSVCEDTLSRYIPCQPSPTRSE